MFSLFPFTLAGPQFLLFYAVFAAVLIIGYRIYASSGGSSDKVRLSQLTDDPYQIAYLRGGPEETVRVAIVNLIDRRLLVNEGSGVKAAGDTSAEFARRGLDRAILAACRATRAARGVAEEMGVRAALAEYEAKLGAKGLLLSAGERASQGFARTAVLLLLGGVAALRLFQAFDRGQSNVLFLILLGFAALILAWKFCERGVASAAGRQALSSLEVLIQRVQRQVTKLRPGGATNEALMLAAVLGIQALPEEAFPYVQQVYPKPVRSSSGSDGSGASSCGSSGGSSCGGGGGGCGGCGGGD